MKVVHVLRKPLSEGTVASNTLKHGTGGLDIDASRVKHTDGEVDFTKRQRQQADPRDKGWGGHVALPGSDLQMHKPSGRWPGNLILQHLDGCRQVGTAQEPSYRIFRWKDGMKAFGGGAGHEYGQTEVEGGVVAVWACAPGCAAVALDEQGQDSPAGKARSAMTPTEHEGPAKFGYNEDRHQFTYGDGGGVSRFFKQVGGEKDA